MKYQVNIGDVYGLLVVKDIYKKDNKTCYECLCDCGNIKKIFGAYKLATGAVQSCGCLTSVRCAERNHSNAKYDKTDRRLHDIWRQMHQRCENTDHISYKNYGAKGIKVCEDWDDYTLFKKWALSNGYNEALTIDRIDGALGYMPSNCRWVSMKVQNNNSTHCHYIAYNGKTQSLSAWAEELGISREVLKDRIGKLGWSIKMAFETSVNKKYCHRAQHYESGDFDGDLCFTTDNEVLIRNHRMLPAIFCVQRKGEKKVVTEEDIIESNKLSFGDAIGATTNIITSQICKIAEFAKNSKENQELAYRVLCGQLYQQNI